MAAEERADLKGRLNGLQFGNHAAAHITPAEAKSARRQSRVPAAPAAESSDMARAGSSRGQALAHDKILKQPLLQASDVRAALAQLSSQSVVLDERLATLRKEALARMEQSKATLAGMGNHVRLIGDEAKVLEERLAQTGKTAERISESVRRLDEEIARVRLAREWTEKAADLKASLQSMAAAITQQDYNSAAQHCARALSIDRVIVESRFASLVVPSSEYPEPPPVMLENLRAVLLQTFTERFEQAAEARNTVEATHFFMLFPQVGWKKEGLAVYSRFAKSIVRERGHAITDNLGSGAASKSNSPTHHANLLTILFEHLAFLIDQHQPLVDRHYGLGNFAGGVMPSLQDECDRLGKRVCEAWYEDRSVSRRLAEAKAYSFTYVASIGTPKKANSTAQRTVAGFHVPGRPATPSNDAAAAAEDLSQIPDTREIDRIAGEVAAMSARWGTYRRFLEVRLSTGSSKEELDQDGTPHGLKDFRAASSTKLEGADHSAQHDAAVTAAQIGNKDTPAGFAKATGLGRRIAELMETVYVPAETWFLRCSIEKAHRLDAPDSTSRPMSSPLLDDVFYLVRLVLTRAVSTANLDILSTLCRHVRYIVDEDFVQAIVRLLDFTARSTSSQMAVEGPRKDAATRDMRVTFAVYLNVLSTSTAYIGRILDELSTAANIRQHYADNEVETAINTLQGLGVLLPRVRNAIRTHTDLLFSTLLRPKTRQLLTDSLRDVTYVLDEEAFAHVEEEANAHGGASLFVRKFTRGWDALMSSGAYRDIFVPDVWETILRLAVDVVVQTWEQWVMNVQYSELGALRFDKDLRTISTFLGNQSAAGGLRERFARLTHISYLVNLDEDEAVSPMAGAGQVNDGSQGVEDGKDSVTPVRETNDDVAWRLSADEVKQIRQRRLGW